MSGHNLKIDQIEVMFKDRKFFIFMNSYFCAHKLILDDTYISRIKNETNLDDFQILFRVLLAQVLKLRELLESVEKQISYIQSETRKDFVGTIEGALRVNEYIRRRRVVQYPRIYPCTVRQRSQVTPENVFILLVVRIVVDSLTTFEKRLHAIFGAGKFSESHCLEEHINYFRSWQRRGPFMDIISDLNSSMGRHTFVPPELRNNVLIKLKKRQIINPLAYQKLLEWYDSFASNGFIFSESKDIGMLRYDDSFTDKLFELWVLHSIKVVMVEDFKLQLVSENHLKDRKNKPIYVIKTIKGLELKIYFQKGHGVFWNNDYGTKWRYKVSDAETKFLRGIPDIAVKCTNGRLVTVDVKNRLRNSGENSEEIYKMLGYYENFGDSLRSRYGHQFRFFAALVFRNDLDCFSEILSTDSSDQMLVMSATPSLNHLLCRDKFRELARFILDSCSGEGVVSEVVGEYINYRTGLIQLDSECDNLDEEAKATQLTENNHQVLEGLFNNNAIAQKLPQTEHRLSQDHFPHVWDKMDSRSAKMLSMAECLYKEIGHSDTVDYAPVSLEFCRALEVELNNAIISRLKSKEFPLKKIISRNKHYNRLGFSRDLTLGECLFILEHLNDSDEASYLLKSNLKKHSPNVIKKLDVLISSVRKINNKFRINAAHTKLITYNLVCECREHILGIGMESVFYILLDKRDLK